MNNLYQLIFLDSFKAHFILSFSDELAFSFAIYYGLNKLQCSCFAFLGSICGLLASLLIFSILGFIFKKMLEQSYNFSPLKFYFNKYKYLILSVTAFPNASILAPFFCGLLRMNIYTCTTIFIFYRVVYYCYFLYSL
jgi:membrane protein YqaA with SNARE-associated domain